jgi:hypothetical protein
MLPSSPLLLTFTSHHSGTVTLMAALLILGAGPFLLSNMLQKRRVRRFCRRVGRLAHSLTSFV